MSGDRAILMTTQKLARHVYSGMDLSYEALKWVYHRYPVFELAFRCHKQVRLQMTEMRTGFVIPKKRAVCRYP